VVLIDLLEGPDVQDLREKRQTMIATDADRVLEEHQVITMVAMKDFHDSCAAIAASIERKCRYTLR
jgi:hypothetical protein